VSWLKLTVGSLNYTWTRSFLRRYLHDCFAIGVFFVASPNQSKPIQFFEAVEFDNGCMDMRKKMTAISQSLLCICTNWLVK